MRKFLSVLLVLAVASSLKADPPDEDILRPRIPKHGKFFVGADAGLNTSWFDANPIYRAFFPSEEESRMFRSAFGFEPFGSVSFGINFTQNIRVHIRGDYDARVAIRSGATVDTSTIIDAVTNEVVARIPTDVEKEYRLDVTYLTVSLLGEYSIDQLFIFLGPSWATPFKRTYTETDHIRDANSIGMYFSNTPDSTRDIVAEVSGTDNVSSILSIKLGVGYMIPMSEKLSFVPQIGFDFPFGTALKADEDYEFRSATGSGGGSLLTRLNHNMYFRALQASVGLRLSF